MLTSLSAKCENFCIAIESHELPGELEDKTDKKRGQKRRSRHRKWRNFKQKLLMNKKTVHKLVKQIENYTRQVKLN